MRFRKILTLTAGLLAALAMQARADIINSSYAFGSADPGNPSSLLREEERLVHLINLYNGTPSVAPDANTYTSLSGANVPAAPLPGWDGTSAVQLGGGATSFNLDVTGWDYLMVKWSDTSYYYFVGNLTGTQTVDNDVVFNNQGVPQNASHYRLFGGNDDQHVPDGGMTLMLLGAGLSGLGFVRKTIKK